MNQHEYLKSVAAKEIAQKLGEHLVHHPELMESDLEGIASAYTNDSEVIDAAVSLVDAGIDIGDIG